LSRIAISYRLKPVFLLRKVEALLALSPVEC